jgi:stage II sporulation protein D
VPLPSRLQNEVVSRWSAVVLAACLVAVTSADEPPVRVSIGGRVTRLNLEEYVARVVAGEGQPRAADGAQQALAITARTYALANLNRHRREGFDLCDTTHCQVLRPATDGSRRAARATAGLVLTHQGRTASVYYSALCGGHSELASEVWPGADDSSSHLHEDEACRDEPGWSSDISRGDIEKALRAAGHRGSRLRDVRVVKRNDSGRVTRLRVDGFTPNEVTGHDFRMAVSRVAGPQIFRSTAFEVRRNGSGYRFAGTGYGHGVGLCVIGAGKRAAEGDNADEILEFYFPNLRITPRAQASGRAPAVVTPLSRAPAVAGASRSDLSIALPAPEGNDRDAIARLIRAARDDIARRTSVTVPSEIRVVVHTTVEAFVRATGQPWWMSGSTDGAQIDLVPVNVLRQRGQFERAIRHEVAHAVLDASLGRKPVWVREGAAFYFADPEAADGDTRVRGNCPGDEELLRPISAGAHRNALSRAEACFRRAMARGRKWDQVR